MAAEGKRKHISGKATADEVKPHLEGFELALMRALENASDGFEKGTHEVAVRFRAVMEVENPGRIQSYHVVIEPAAVGPQ
jgi:hypothetical protein